MRLLFLFLLLLMLASADAENFSVIDAEDNEISVELYPANGDLLIIWLVDHEQERRMFEQLLDSVNAAGIELWRVDLLASYFLPRSTEAQISLSGDGVAALLRSAHELRNKTVLLVAYDRMVLPLLRGARLWQQRADISRLAGAVLFYPNLFGPAPVAGEDPMVDPILEATNIPVVIYQPETGNQRWRLGSIMDALWRGGSPAFAYIVPGVRDWFFMGEENHGPGNIEATRAIPGQLRSFAELMNNFPKPETVTGTIHNSPLRTRVTELVELPGNDLSPEFSLLDLHGSRIHWTDYQGKVTLVNFWATWCPPCVEEIPSLNRLAARYRKDDFAVVSIDYRETRQALQNFIADIPVDFPILFDDDGKTSLQWKVFSFPSSYLIDRKGRIRYSANRAIDWDTEETWKIVEKLLAE